MARLCDPVDHVLAEKQEMNLRLRNIENAVTSQAGSTEPEGGRDSSVTPSGTATLSHGPPEDILEGVHRDSLGSAFDKDLLGSRFDRKVLLSRSGDSLVMSSAR